ncbi:hypothetical protein ABFV05_000768 [Capra hircus]
MKSNKAKANIVDQSHLHDSSQKGVIDLAALGITGRQVDLVKTKQEPDDKRARKHVKQDSNVSEEWKSMFGSLEPPSMQQALPKGSDQEVTPAGKPPRSESSAAICVPLSTSPQVPEVTNVQNRKPTVQVFSSTILPSTSQIRITTCKAELQQLIQQKREQCSAERIAKQMMGNAEWESKPPPPEHQPTIFPFPELLGDWEDEGNPDVQRKKEPANGHPRVQGSKGDLKGIPDDADCSVSLARPEEEQQATATHPRGDEQRRDELPGRITSLHTEEASLGCENSQLEREIQQSLPDLRDRHVMQLHRRLLKESRCLESKKILLSICRELNSVCQIRNLSKKRAGDLSEELETTAACHRQEVRLCEERAQESWVAALRMERALSEQTPENAASGSCWPRSSSTPSSPRGAFMFLLLHPQPAGAHRGQGSPCITRHPRRGGGSSPEDAGAQGHLQAQLSSAQPGPDTHDQDTTSASVIPV